MKAFTLGVSMALVAVLSQDAHAYLHFTTSGAGQSRVLKWQRTPVRWFAADRGVPGVSASDLQAATARAFATWEAVPAASITFQFAGFTGAEPFDEDNVSVIGFEDHPDMERVLGATGFLIDTITGEIVESDIFFNSAFQWSTAAQGDPTRFDLESVAVHEIGHFLGLGHSALGETEMRPEGGRRVLGSASVMFPVALGRGITHDRELQPDDMAGISDLYPAAGFREQSGVARGRVTRNGAGIVGAHVAAFNPRTGALVAAFTLNNDGEFQIAGLDPGPHLIRVEPLDDADVESFFSRSAGVDIDFLVTFHGRLFVAPRGGAGERLTVAVRPK
ncbi:MAG: matrixin family metalloprotease [Acidobacteria bacterium]|nr:matrixin family metalloprotease [Acidobacteriota bacterium]